MVEKVIPRMSMGAVDRLRVVFFALVLTLAPLDRAFLGGDELGGKSALAAAGDNGKGNGGGNSGGGNGGGNAGGNSGGGNAGGNSGGNGGGGNAGGNSGGNAGGNSGGNGSGQGSNAGGTGGSESEQDAPAGTTSAFGPGTSIPGRSSIDMLRDYRTAVLRNDLAAAAKALAAVGTDELSEGDIAHIHGILGIDSDDTTLSDSSIAERVRELRTPAVTPVATEQ